MLPRSQPSLQMIMLQIWDTSEHLVQEAMRINRDCSISFQQIASRSAASTYKITTLLKPKSRLLVL